jgi:hypothetical protein
MPEVRQSDDPELHSDYILDFDAEGNLLGARIPVN